jgi:hypothetical protein
VKVESPIRVLVLLDVPPYESEPWVKVESPIRVLVLLDVPPYGSEQWEKVEPPIVLEVQLWAEAALGVSRATVLRPAAKAAARQTCGSAASPSASASS